MVINDNEPALKCPKKYKCIICDYSTHHNRDYARHILTPKHKNLCQLVINETKNALKVPKNYKCTNCEKEYTFMSGLSRHKLDCKLLPNNTTINSIIAVQLLNEIQNLKEQLRDFVK